MKELRTLAALGMLVGLGLGACDDGDGLDPLSLDATGTVTALLLFDSNGSGTAEATDRRLEGWTLRLEQPAGGTVASGETDENGVVRFENVPVGRLVLAVGEEELGDTLRAVESSVMPFTLPAGAEGTVGMLLTLRSVSVVEARQTPPGQPVFVSGVALNALDQDVRDLHIRQGGDYIRVVSVPEGDVSVGDSVRVRGRTAIDEGVPVLEGQAVFRTGGRTTVTPITVTTGEAADARGGSLDAALVQVLAAELVAVEDLGNDGIRLRVDDGTGPLNLLLRPFLGLDPDDFDPDAGQRITAVGLLVPAEEDGRVSWQLLVRPPD